MGPIMGGLPVLKYSAAGVNIVFDGNSLVAGSGASGSSKFLPAQVAALSPLNGLVTVTNIGVAGQSIANMRTRGTAYADANYVAGKKNILVVWEGTNSICNEVKTGAAAGAEMAGYCADRLAAHPDWIIVQMTTLPRFGLITTYTVAQANAELDAYNAYLQANHRTMGCKRLVDVRTAGIFTYTGPTVNGTMSPYMSDTTHCNDAGYGLVAQYVADVLKRLPAR